MKILCKHCRLTRDEHGLEDNCLGLPVGRFFEAHEQPPTPPAGDLSQPSAYVSVPTVTADGTATPPSRETLRQAFERYVLDADGDGEGYGPFSAGYAYALNLKAPEPSRVDALYVAAADFLEAVELADPLYVKMWTPRMDLNRHKLKAALREKAKGES